MVKNIFKTKKDQFFTQRSYFCIANKIKPVGFYSLYRNYFFE